MEISKVYTTGCKYVGIVKLLFETGFDRSLSKFVRDINKYLSTHILFLEN